MLLYGPPGCGKTYFAKKLAEEVGAHFMIMMPSDIKSKFVNASLENIASMFREAESNAPSIIFIDEINELVPDRDSDVHEMYRSAVNEMLAQMDNTGKKGVFVIGATNKPDQIDPAILRTGRIDYKVYIPPPDNEARIALFDLHLDGRPLSDDVIYEELASRTQGYVSSDIEYIVNEAARSALANKDKISMEILLRTIDKIQPSINSQLLETYENIRVRFQSNDRQIHRKIGF
jgi:transitional endoplasmic reticulum ATPase